LAIRAVKWQAEVAELKRILSTYELTVETKWGKPCYMAAGANVVIIQTFKDYCALGFFQGALLPDPKKRLVQLGSVQAGRVMKFTSVDDIDEKTVKAYVRAAIAAAKAGKQVKTKRRVLPLPAELLTKFRADPKFKSAFEALTPGRQRGYLFHWNGAKQAATRTARIEKAVPAIFKGKGHLERR
jgi:uncharacterized protein YdeI (YjbR/CyaY-like superfamily)